MVTTEPEVSASAETVLVVRARAGDALAFEQLAATCEKRLYQQAVALARDVELAQDLVVETLLHAWRSLRRFDGGCRFGTWAYAILVHRFQHHVRATRCRPPLASSMDPAARTASEVAVGALPDSSAAPDAQAHLRELNAHLQCAISTLPASHQEVVCLRFFEGATLPEIASALGVSVGTVKSRLHYAIRRLRSDRAVMNLLTELGDKGA